MTSLDEQIRKLREQTEFTRYQFVAAEIATSSTALDVAEHELSVGNTVMAEREIEATRKGIQVAERFLPEVGDAHRAHLETKLADLQSALQAVEQKLNR